MNEATIDLVLQLDIPSILSEIPKRFARDRNLIKKCASLLCTILNEFKLYKSSILRQFLVIPTEIFIQNIILGKNFVASKFQFDLVQCILDFYTQVPGSCEIWLSKRSDKKYCGIISSLFINHTPSLSSVLSGLEFTSPGTQYDKLFHTTVLLLNKSSGLRDDFFNTKVSDILLAYPLMLYETFSHEKRESLQVKATSVQLYNFSLSQECEHYMQSLSKFVDITRRLGHEELQNYMILHLIEFFQMILNCPDFNNNSNLGLMLIKGLNIFSKLGFRKASAICYLKSIINNSHFQSFCWLTVLDYHNLITQNQYHNFKKKRLHIEFLEMLRHSLDDDGNILRSVIFTSSNNNKNANIGPTDWLIDMIWEMVDSPQIVVNSFNKLMEKWNKYEHGKSIFTNSFILQILLVRIRIFFLCSPEENRILIQLLLDIDICSKGSIFQSINSEYSKAIIKLFQEAISLKKDPGYIIKVDAELFCSQDIKLLDNENVQNCISLWLGYNNPQKNNKLKISTNFKYLKDLIIQIYCVTKYFKICK